MPIQRSLRIRRTHSFDALRCAESSIRLPCPLKISIVLHIPMFRRPPVILVSAPSKLRTVNEVSFKQHDKRKVIGSKVNGFPLLALLAIRHRGGWRLEVTAHSQRGRFPSDVGRQTNTTIEQKLTWLEREAPRFDICLYNAGMDPFGGCSIGGMQGVTQNVLRDREVAVFSWCRMRGVPIVFVLAGGYLGLGLERAGLVALHRLTLEAACACA